jgi:hypothetical protein
MVYQGLSSKWVKPSLAIAEIGSSQVLPPSADWFTEIAAKKFPLVSVKAKICEK